MTHLAHLALAAYFFAGPLFQNGRLYYRDIALGYYPSYVFAERALARGTWPLWNWQVDGGTPFLLHYPLDAALLWALGADLTWTVGPPLHLLLLAVGTTRLARRLGLGDLAAWFAGAIFASSGLVLSSVSLYPLFLAATWAPWAIDACLALQARVSMRRIAWTAVAVALLGSTLGGLFVLQAGLMALVLSWGRMSRRSAAALALAVVIAFALTAPLSAGVVDLARGTSRDRGLGASALSYSANLAVLTEAVWPRFFGDVHTATDRGYWGQAHYPTGTAYFPSAYVGLGVVALASWARRRSLWGLAALGIVLSLGASGPAGRFIEAMGLFRGPVKFLFIATLSVALLAGEGLDRLALRGPKAHWVAPGGLLIALAGLTLVHPAWTAWTPIVAALPTIDSELARVVIAGTWPRELLITGVSLFAAGLALASPRSPKAIAAALVIADMVRVNVVLNPVTPSDFYVLRPEIAQLLKPARDGGRVYSYGLAHSPPLQWSAAATALNHDALLFYVDRQSLLPRTQVIDGFSSLYDLDRTGFAPAGTTLSPAEAHSRNFSVHYDRFRIAGIRWILAFEPLARELTIERGTARFPFIVQPLRLFELPAAYPFAFWVPSDAARPPHGYVTWTAAPPELGTVAWRRVDEHTLRIRASTPSGYIIVLEGFHANWSIYGTDGDRAALTRANGLFWAIQTPGGAVEYEARYEPRWRAPALSAAVVGGLACLGLVLAPVASARKRTQPT